MKLKLDSQDALAILSVLESIDPTQLPVLKAGVMKLLQKPGSHHLILDLTAVHAPSLENAEVINALALLRQSAATAGKRLLIASSRAGLGDGPTAAACVALQKAAEPHAKAELAATETPELQEVQLKKTLEILKAEQAEAQKSIAARSADGDEIRKLQKENTQIKKLIQTLEKEIAIQLKLRATGPLEIPADLKAKLIDIDDVLGPLVQSLAGGKP